jgi:hypothetical protein
MKPYEIVLAVIIIAGCVVLARGEAFIVFKAQKKDEAYHYKCERVPYKDNDCVYPICDEDEDRCKDNAESLNAAHERRTFESLSAKEKCGRFGGFYAGGNTCTGTSY